MAANAPSTNPLPLDPEDELTRPEVRPGLRTAAGTVEPPPGLLGPPVPALPTDPAAGDSDENADAVTLVDLGRRRLVNVETLPPPALPPSELPDLE